VPCRTQGVDAPRTAHPPPPPPASQAIIFAVIMSLIWLQIGSDQNSMQDRVGLLFFIGANGMMQAPLLMSTTNTNITTSTNPSALARPAAHSP
jgi:hypothetical protein